MLLSALCHESTKIYSYIFLCVNSTIHPKIVAGSFLGCYQKNFCCPFLNLFLGGDGRGHIFFLKNGAGTSHSYDTFQKLLLKKSAVPFKPVLPIDERRHTCIDIEHTNAKQIIIVQCENCVV